MKNTIKTIALSVAFLSSAGKAYAPGDERPTEVTVDTGVHAPLHYFYQQVAHASALNLAVNTGDVDASVDLEAIAEATREAPEAISSIEGTIETTAIGAANTGSISIEQGSYNKVVSDISDATDNYDYS